MYIQKREREIVGGTITVSTKILKEFGPMAALVWGLILSYESSDKGCFASNDTLAEKLGIKRRYLQEIIALLEKEKWLKVLWTSTREEKMKRRFLFTQKIAPKKVVDNSQ